MVFLGPLGWRRLLCFLWAFMLIVLVSNQAIFATSSSWLLNADSPALNKVAADQRPLIRPNYNRDCLPDTGLTRRAKLTSPFITEQTITGCTSYSSFGAFNSDHLRLNNTWLYGKIVHPTGGSFGVMPIPNSSTVLYFSGNDGFSAVINYIEDFPRHFKTRVLPDGRVEHVLQPFTQKQLRDGSGNIIRLNVSSIGFSKNGQWLVANSPYWGAVRVNLQTFEVLPFDKAFNYFGGIAPAVQNAISGDGRYAVISSGNFFRFKIYDLSTCPQVPSTLTGPVVCTSRDLYPFMQKEAPGYFDATEIRFISNSTFKFYGSILRPGASAQTNLYTLSAPGQVDVKYEYLALGDSFASGEGAYSYRDGTDTKLNKCHTSLVSYPYLIADETGLSTSQSVACSGAKIHDYFGLGDQKYEGQASDKIKRESRDAMPILNDFDPGYIAQKEFVENKSPQIITLSFAGNDIGFSGKIMRCLEPDTCFSSYEDRLEIVREINNQFERLVAMYKDLGQSSPGAKIYVIGYPQIAQENGNCAVNVHLNNDEIIFSNQLVVYLNSVIRKATLKAGVTYVDASQAFVGYRLCETESKNVAVNGLTAGNDIIEFLGGPIGNESYHPNALGHRLFKNVILSQTDNLTKANPLPDVTVQNPTDSPSLQILQAPKTNRQIFTVNYDAELTNNVLVRGAWYDVTKTSVSAILPLSNVVFWLNSDPVNLGTFQTNESGELNARVHIPQSVSPGFHTLHLQGTNIAGESVDFYKTVFVDYSEGDFDGDGIQNSDDQCSVVGPSGQDIDQDGIDDACDGMIDDPPAIQEAPINMGESDIKPPENNPETVAGHEPLFESEQVASVTTGTSGTASQQTSGSPILQQALLSATGQSSSQITEDNSTKSSENPSTSTRVKTNWLTLFIVTLLSLTAFGAYKHLKK